MVDIFSSHGPLINQLKPARPILAGFLHAFAAAPASTNTIFLCKECTSHVHQHLPQLCPGFPWRCFSAPNLSSHHIVLLRVFIRAMSPFAMTTEDGPPLPQFHLPDATWKMQIKSCFCSSGARANHSARLFPSPDNEPQPWVRGTTSGDKETVQSTAYLFFNFFDEAAKKGSISTEEFWLLHSSARNIHFSLQAGQHPSATNRDSWVENQDLSSSTQIQPMLTKSWVLFTPCKPILMGPKGCGTSQLAERRQCRHRAHSPEASEIRAENKKKKKIHQRTP